MRRKILAFLPLVFAASLAAQPTGPIPIQRSDAELRQEVDRLMTRLEAFGFSGSLLVAAMAATFILVLGLAMGVPLAPAAAVWMLLVNLIPQVGGLLGGGFFTILAFSTRNREG